MSETNDIELTTEQKIEKVIFQVAEGMALKEALAQNSLSNWAFRSVLEKSVPLQTSYDRARASRTHLQAEEIIGIADNESIDPQRARNMIDARKWYSSKMLPKEYGDRIDVHVETVDLRAAIAEGRARALRSMRDLDAIEDAQVIEPKQLTASGSTDYPSADGAESGDATDSTSIDPLS